MKLSEQLKRSRYDGPINLAIGEPESFDIEKVSRERKDSLDLTPYATALIGNYGANLNRTDKIVTIPLTVETAAVSVVKSRFASAAKMADVGLHWMDKESREHKDGTTTVFVWADRRISRERKTKSSVMDPVRPIGWRAAASFVTPVRNV